MDANEIFDLGEYVDIPVHDLLQPIDVGDLLPHQTILRRRYGPQLNRVEQIEVNVLHGMILPNPLKERACGLEVVNIPVYVVSDKTSGMFHSSVQQRNMKV